MPVGYEQTTDTVCVCVYVCVCGGGGGGGRGGGRGELGKTMHKLILLFHTVN